ncbi:hypothetical protein ACHQM5_018814 [Ranunculus cassubicifolius]
MVELRSQQPQEEGSIALTDDQIADQVLGIKFGYVQGLGHGVIAPSSRIAGFNRVEVDELRRRAVDAESAVQRLQAQQEQETNDLRQKMDAQREEMQQQRFLLERLMEQLQNGQGSFPNT